MYSRILRNGTHIRTFTISSSMPSGWEVKDQAGVDVLGSHRYNDWHRVERAMLMFTVEAARLLDEGWTESGNSAIAPELRAEP